MTLNFRHIYLNTIAGFTAFAAMKLATTSFAVAAPQTLDVPEAQTGLPQLDSTTYSSQIFWLIVSFLVLYVLMSKMALPKVSEVLETRANEINNNLNRAEKFQAEMEEVRTSYEAALAKAHADAADVVKKIETMTAEKINQKHNDFAAISRDRLMKSEKNIKSAKDDVLSSLEDIAADITKDALKKVANINVKKEDALTAVRARMKEAA